jgi:hypothetical protein
MILSIFFTSLAVDMDDLLQMGRSLRRLLLIGWLSRRVCCVLDSTILARRLSKVVQSWRGCCPKLARRLLSMKVNEEATFHRFGREGSG